MTAENASSTPVSNMDALPRVPNNSRLDGGAMQVAKATVATVLAASGDGSTYRMVRLPQGAVVHAVYFTCDDLGSTGAVNIGVYLPREGAVVDADHFASAVVVTSAIITRTDVTHESGQYPIEEAELPLFEALGKAYDFSPEGYDIVITMSTITTAVGDMTLEVHFTE